jgi:hypothetical protein
MAVLTREIANVAKRNANIEKHLKGIVGYATLAVA